MINYMKNRLLIILLAASVFACSEEPEAIAPSVISASDLVFDVEENVIEDDVVGTITASVVPEGELRYRITSQTPRNVVWINSETGVLKVSDLEFFDYENDDPNTLELEVEVVSEDDVKQLINVTINVINVNEPFITSWRIGDDKSITLFTNPEYAYNYKVDWGDGITSENITSDAVHTYAESGYYEVKIFGQFPAPFMAKNYLKGGGPEKRMESILQWGDNEWESFYAAFAGTHVLSLAKDIPNLSKVTNMNSMFSNCWNLRVDNIDAWDVSNVTDMSKMFAGCTNFNGDIGNWDVSHVVDMSNMFRLAQFFNQDISKWDVSSVKSMFQMFAITYHFNADISAWDVSNVENFGSMFFSSMVFNQDIGNWDMSSATNMNRMLYYTLKFDQNLERWNFPNVSDLEYFLEDSNMSIDNYTQTLLAWNANPNLRDDVYLGVGKLKYCGLGAAARDGLIERGWTFNGDIRASEEECQ